MRVITYVRAVRVNLSEDISPLHTCQLLAYAWEAHHPPILKQAKRAWQLQLHYSMPRSCLSLEKGKFFGHNDNNCEHNITSFGEMWNRIMQQYWSIINASLSVIMWRRHVRS